MSAAKLHINITQGIIDAEGDVEFVMKVYEDFRDRISTATESDKGTEPDTVDTDSDETASENSASAGVRKSKSKRAPSSRPTRSSVSGNAYKPRLVDDLDTSGLKDFIAGYSMTNHSNNIVAFLKFLEGKGRKPATLDEVYTCYRDASVKLPTAYVQAFRDAASKKRFIEFIDATSVELTIRGSNHIDHGSMDKKVDTQ